MAHLSRKLLPLVWVGLSAALHAGGVTSLPAPSGPLHARELADLAAPAALLRRRTRTPVAVVQPDPKPPVLGLGVRRWIYNTLAPLDRGEFKWEFLVPWTNKTLTSADKFIVCSTFIGLSFVLQTVLEPRASVGVHLSYIAQFFSYAMGDPIGFRSLAVLTSVLEIGGNLFETKESGMIIDGVNFDLETAFQSVNAED